MSRFEGTYLPKGIGDPIRVSRIILGGRCPKGPTCRKALETGSPPDTSRLRLWSSRRENLPTSPDVQPVEVQALLRDAGDMNPDLNAQAKSPDFDDTHPLPPVGERVLRRLLREFDDRIEELRAELEFNVVQGDMMDRPQREKVLGLVQTRTRQSARQFLRQLEEFTDSELPETPARKAWRQHLADPVPGLVGAGAGTAAYFASQMLVVETIAHGMWWWKTTAEITLAGKVAVLLGISAAMASWFLAALVAVPTFLLTKRLSRPLFARWMNRLILRSFDREVLPPLRAWAREVIATVA